MTVARRPVYFRLLRIRHLNTRPWVTFVLFEGSIAVGVLLALADIVSQWGVIAVPVAVAAMVKLNDVVAAAQSEPLAAAQLRTPRLQPAAAVGRSPVPRLRPTVRLPWRGGTRREESARGVAPVPARPPATTPVEGTWRGAAHRATPTPRPPTGHVPGDHAPDDHATKAGAPDARAPQDPSTAGGGPSAESGPPLGPRSRSSKLGRGNQGRFVQ